MIGEPVDLSHAEYVEITITRDRVYVHTDRGLMFRAYRVGKITVKDNRTLLRSRARTPRSVEPTDYCSARRSPVSCAQMRGEVLGAVEKAMEAARDTPRR